MVLFALSIGWFVVIVDSTILVGAAAYGCALLCALAVGSPSRT